MTAFFPGACWWRMRWLLVQVGATALICDRLEALTPTIAFVPECQVNREEKGNHVLPAVFLWKSFWPHRLPERFSEIPEVCGPYVENCCTRGCSLSEIISSLVKMRIMHTSTLQIVLTFKSDDAMFSNM